MNSNIIILVSIVCIIVILSVVYKSNIEGFEDNSAWNKLAGSNFCDQKLDGTIDHINKTFCDSSIKTDSFSNLSALIVNTPNEFTTKTIPYGQFKYGPSNINNDSLQFTYSLWIKVKNIKDYWRGIFRAGIPANDGSRMPGLWIYPKSLGLHFRVSTTVNGNEGLDIPAGNLSLNKWVHIAYTVNNKNIKSFVNGKLINDEKLSGPMNPIPNNMSIQLNNYNNAIGDIDIAKLRIFPIEVPEQFIKTVLVRETPDDNLDYQTCLLRQHGKALEDAHISCQSLLINKDVDANSNGRNIQLKDNNSIANNKNFYNIHRIPSYKIVNGIVYLSGVVLATGLGEIGYLPEEARPDKTICAIAGNVNPVRVDIKPNGNIVVVAGNPDGYISLDNIHYSIKSSTQTVLFTIPQMTRYVKMSSPIGMPLHITEIQAYDDNGIVVSSGKNVYQSSQYQHGNPERVVDGKIDGNWANRTVNHTLNTSDINNPEHIEIDLGKEYNIVRVDVFNRTDCCKDRIIGSTVSLLDSNKTVLVSQKWTEPNNGLDNKWKCILDLPVPLRKNAKGDVECMSTNGRDCLWSGSMDRCNALEKSPPSNLNPLQCGEMHNRVWGGTGYNNERHWCTRGMNYSAGASDTKTFSFGSQLGNRTTSQFNHYGGEYRAVSYSIINGSVYLSGLAITKRSINNEKAIIGILTKEACPSVNRILMALSIDRNGKNIEPVRLDIQTDGKVVIYRSKKDYEVISLDSLCYSIDSTSSTNLTLTSGYSGYFPRVLAENESLYKLDLYYDTDRPKSISNISIPKDMTISMWLNAKRNGRQNPVHKGYGGDGAITIEPNGSISYYFGPKGGNQGPYTGLHTTKPIEFDKWTHLAIVRNISKRQVQIYINGIEADYTNEQPAGILDVAVSNEPLRIGSGYVNNYSGKIKDLKIFGRPLSTIEITGLITGQASLEGVSQPSVTNSNGVVQMQGIIELSSGTGENAGRIAEIPEQFRPNRQLKFVVGQGNKSALIEISQDGIIYLSRCSPYVGYISLDGVQYITNK